MSGTNQAAGPEACGAGRIDGMTTAPKRTKRSHMVTEKYLEAWADERNVIDVRDLQERKGYYNAIANASVANYVYDAAVLSVDLENRFAEIESDGISAIRKLRRGVTELDPREAEAIIAFLDMHYLRGRLADRVDHTQQATTVSVDLTTGESTSRETDLKLGDMYELIRQHPDTLRLANLGLERWEWNIVGGWEQLVAGDGAALVWALDPNSDAITSVTFPISPTQLLVIGADIPGDAPVNAHVVDKSRRWVFGKKDTLPPFKGGA
jgi:Protein of unknown function (DUF4238)